MYLLFSLDRCHKYLLQPQAQGIHQHEPTLLDHEAKVLVRDAGVAKAVHYPCSELSVDHPTGTLLLLAKPAIHVLTE